MALGVRVSHDEALHPAEALAQALTRAETAESELAESRALHKALATEARKHFVLLNVSGDELSVENIAELGRWIDSQAGVDQRTAGREQAMREVLAVLDNVREPQRRARAGHHPGHGDRRRAPREGPAREGGGMSDRIHMRMAKASREDIDAAMTLSSAFDTIRYGYEPGEAENFFDVDDPASCQRTLKHLLAICERGSLMRVIWGLAVLIDPANQVVDPDSSVLELHPRFGKAVRGE